MGQLSQKIEQKAFLGASERLKCPTHDTGLASGQYMRDFGLMDAHFEISREKL